MLEQAGIWRLPEGLDGYQVVGAADGGSNDVSSATTPGVLAVDLPEDLQRWLMVQAYDEFGEVPETARQVQLSNEVTASLIPTDGSTWFQITPTGEPGSDRVATGSALGIDDEELVQLLTDHLGSIDALTQAGSSTAPMEAMLTDAGFDGSNTLVWQGDEDPGPGGGNQAIELTLLRDDGTEVVVMLNDSVTPAWAQLVRLRMSAELFSMPMADQQPLAMSIRTRSDLGRGVLENSMGPVGQDPATSLAVLTDDGVVINVYPAGMAATPQPIGSLSDDEQLRIINSLRAMSEDEFRSRLAELGGEFIGAESGVTTTVIGSPGD